MLAQICEAVGLVASAAQGFYLVHQGRALPCSDQIIPSDFNDATVRLCLGGALLGGSTTRALIKDIKVNNAKVADESSELALNGESEKPEIGQPEEI